MLRRGVDGNRMGRSRSALHAKILEHEFSFVALEWASACQARDMPLALMVSRLLPDDLVLRATRGTFKKGGAHDCIS
jgi:hypothetical protein